MSEIVFRGTAIPHGKTRGFAFAFVLGLTGIIFAGIVLVGGNRAPSGAMEMMPYIGIPSVFLLLWSGWLWMANRGDIFLTKGKNNVFGITIVSSGRKKLVELFSPFAILYGFQLFDPGRGPRSYRMFMIFRDEEDNCLLALESGRGEIMGAPQGWKEITDHQLGELTNHYNISHMSELAKPLQKFLR